jgi:hypothetical protein
MVPRSMWVVDAISRAPSGKPDYGRARQYAADHPAAGYPAAPDHPVTPDHPVA